MASDCEQAAAVPSKTYKVLVSAAVILAVGTQTLSTVPGVRLTTSSYDSLAALCVFLVGFATLAGVRPLKDRFESLGFSKAAALADIEYMRERKQFRIWIAVGAVALALLYSPRIHLIPAIGVILAAAGLSILLPLADRLGGWKEANVKR